MFAARPHRVTTHGPAWHFSDLNLPLAGATLAAVLAWIGLLLVVRAMTRPRMPHAGPKSMDLRPESPAVAEFLTGGWEIGGSAVQATLVDLAARGFLGFEQVGPDPRDTVIRVKANVPTARGGAADGGGWPGAAAGGGIGSPGGIDSPGGAGWPGSAAGGAIPATGGLTAPRLYGASASGTSSGGLGAASGGLGSAGAGARPIPARGNHADLLPYEKRILARVTTLASGGVVPARALQQGTKEQDAKWHKAFDREVVSDARAHGLSRRRYSFRIKALLLAAALVPAILAGLAADRSRANGDGNGGAFAAVLFAAFVLVGMLDGDRETAAGRVACGEWLGVRDWIAADEQFRRLPPAAVALWDRYLGYGAGFGITRTTIAALPLGARDERRAWSTYGGVWHEVKLGYIQSTARRVRHPKQSVRLALRRIAACLVLVPGLIWIAAHKVWRVNLPLGHGTDIKVFTALAIAVACVIASVSLFNVDSRPSKGLIVGVAFYILAPGALLWYISHTLTLKNYVVSSTYIDYALGAVSAFLALVTVWYLILLFGAIADLALRQQIIGEVVRIRDRAEERHIAVDPGGVPKVHAWPVATGAYSSLEEGSTVTVDRGRWFGHVFAVTVTTASTRGNLFAETV